MFVLWIYCVLRFVLSLNDGTFYADLVALDLFVWCSWLVWLSVTFRFDLLVIV